MKFFVDPDNHWDLKGYREYIPTLKPRLSTHAYEFFSKNSFHDATFLGLTMINEDALPGRRRSKDPTIVEIRLWHRNEYQYTLRYTGIAKIELSFDWKRQRIVGLDGVERPFPGDWSGLGEWGYDELTVVDETYLSHEILFHSEATLLLYFRHLDYKRSQKKSRFK
jgi:hypothetical protein